MKCRHYCAGQAPKALFRPAMLGPRTKMTPPNASCRVPRPPRVRSSAKDQEALESNGEPFPKRNEQRTPGTGQGERSVLLSCRDAWAGLARRSLSGLLHCLEPHAPLPDEDVAQRIPCPLPMPANSRLGPAARATATRATSDAAGPRTHAAIRAMPERCKHALASNFPSVFPRRTATVRKNGGRPIKRQRCRGPECPRSRQSDR